MCKKPKGIHNRIDKCMKNIIKIIPGTFACCCGHQKELGGKYPMTIVLKNIKGEFYEAFSGIIIPRKRNFYKKDKQGYYFIPEVLEKNKWFVNLSWMWKMDKSKEFRDGAKSVIMNMKLRHFINVNFI